MVAEKVKQAVDLVSLASEVTSLKKRGKHLMGLCPFHPETHPSFCIDPEKQLFYCHGCGAGGDVFNFVMKLHNFTFHEALNFLAQKAGIEEVEDEGLKFLKEMQILFSKTLSLSKTAAAYLERRKIPLKTALKAGLGLTPKNLLCIISRRNQLLQARRCGFKSERFIRLFEARLTFPFYNRCGTLVGFAARTLTDKEPKYINTVETEYFKKRTLLFGLNQLKERNKVYVVEGYFDCISCLINGIPAVAAGGTSFTAEQAALLKGFKKVILALDGDHAGKIATLKAFKTMIAADIYPYAVFLPTHEDPDSMLRKGKKDQFLQLPERDIFKIIINSIQKLPPQKAAEKLNSLAEFLANTETTLSKILLQKIKNTFSIKIKKHYKKRLELEKQILKLLLSSPEAAEEARKKQLLGVIKNTEIRKTLEYFAEHRTLPEGHAYMNLLAETFIHPPQKDLVEKAMKYLERKKVCAELAGG